MQFVLKGLPYHEAGEALVCGFELMSIVLLLHTGLLHNAAEGGSSRGCCESLNKNRQHSSILRSPVAMQNRDRGKYVLQVHQYLHP